MLFRSPGKILGDPTEGALIYLADAFGIDQLAHEDAYPRVFEQPFDSDRKRMSTVHEENGSFYAYTKGAVDEMLPLCTQVLTAEGPRPMTESDRESILQLCYDMSAQALRVLGFAMKRMQTVPEDDDENIEYELTFLGACGMIDPPRKEVIDAVETCHRAGIRTIMITGDHKVTAMAIAKQLGIFREGNTVIEGNYLHTMPDEALDEKVKTTTVFARVSPADKLRIIQSLKRIGEVAAMTGDGVNDAPALKSADVGIAMGITGTEVSKDAASMILTDDNFATIVKAVMTGRNVYANIKNTITYLLSGNFSGILCVLFASDRKSVV